MRKKFLLSNIGKVILSEQAKVAQQLLDLGMASLKNLSDDIFKKLPPLVDADGAKILNGDELYRAILNHGITGTELGKLYSGILKNSDTSLLKSNPELEKFLIDRLLTNKNVLKKYTPLSKFGRIKELQRVGYPTEVAQKIVNEMDTKLSGVVKQADDVAATGAEATGAAATTGAEATGSGVGQAVREVGVITEKQINELINSRVRLYFKDINPKKWYSFFTRYGKEMKNEMTIAANNMSNASTYEEVAKVLDDIVLKMSSLKQSSVATKLGTVKIDSEIAKGTYYRDGARRSSTSRVSSINKIKYGSFAAGAVGIWFAWDKLSSMFGPDKSQDNLNDWSNFLGLAGNPDMEGIINSLGGDSTSTGGIETQDQSANVSPKLQEIMKKYNVSPSKDAYGKSILRIDNYPGGGVILYLDRPDGGRIQSLTNPPRTGTWSINQLNERLSLYNLVLEQEVEITLPEITKLVKDISDQLNGDYLSSDSTDMADALAVLKSAVGKTYDGKDAIEMAKEFFQGQYDETIEQRIADQMKSLDATGQVSRKEFLSLLQTGGSAGNELANKIGNGLQIAWNGVQDELFPTSSDSSNQQPEPQQAQPEPQQAQPEPQQAQPQPAAQQTDGRPKLAFRQCNGTYTPGCVNTDAIAQVQRCLDLTTNRHPRGSGFYDYALDDKLKAMGYTNGFTDADVSKICHAEATSTKPFEAQENDTPGESTESPRQTYEKYYAKLDGKETNRVKLKVSNLPDNDLTNLNKYFATQGLYKIKEPKRRYGTKFVWGKKPS